ncbi:ATP-binding protein [Marinilactibacillus psychrotolerans]|uniref:DNA double-strand break repair Rad50 ATPase n=1 Tax=Marinilactibacillus psychrotolerans 42ea TaxID=1255609 RepID=A0A1R4JCZ4_9LACT|nr:AAA family ATPase [Marinilactibacillus psychrotolerans]SJN29917.1 DNA double-strand break repair Rad50 ATPase [Marinilactibacillus psychrotolerans 42ea]
MRIKTLTIYGYGKWIDKTFDFSPEYHVIYGKNEAGKSTLMSFIHSILFGFPTRHSALLRYEPKDSSRYGGKLIIDDERFGIVSIERVQGKSTGDVKVLLADGSTGSDDLLHKIIYGIDRNLYQSVFSFHLKGIEQVEEMTKDQLSRYFLSAGALGTEQFLKRSDQLKQQANQLYKPTGRIPEINQALKKIEAKKASMEEAKSKNTQYLDLLQKVENISREIDKSEIDKRTFQKQIESLRQVEQNWESILEISQLEKDIEQLNTSGLSENGLYELNHLNKQIEEIRKEILKLQGTLKEFQKEYEPSKELIMYQENEKNINFLAIQLESISDMIREKMFIDKEADRLQQNIIKNKVQEGLESNEELSVALSGAERNQVDQWRVEYNEVEQMLTTLKEAQFQVEYKKESLEENIDQLEKTLWSNEKFRKEEEYHDEIKNNQQNKPTTTLEIIFISASIIGVLVTAMLNLFMPWASFGFVFIIVGSLISSLLKKNRNQKKNQDFSTYEAYIEQKEMRRQWRQYLFNIDKLEEEKRSNQKERDILYHRENNILEQWINFKKYKHINTSIELIDALKHEDKMIVLREQGNELRRLRKAALELEKDILLKMEPFKKMGNLFSEDDTPEQKVNRFKNYYNKVKEEKNHLQQYVIESQEVRRALNQLFENEKEYLVKKQNLLQEAGADSEDVFRHLYGILKQKNEKEERLKILKEQIPAESVENFAFSKEEIENNRVQLQEEINKIKEKIKMQTEQKIKLEINIKNLEEGGEYTALLQEFENEKSLLQELVNKWISKRLASYMIERTLKYARKDRFPETIKDAERYFAHLTNDAYKKIVINNETVWVLTQDGNYLKAEELSRGTAEPLYVALRLAFIANIQDTIRMPLLIDDGFVNLDRNRRARMYQLLKEISKKTQVIYFSFDSTSYKNLEENQITFLTNEL